MIQGYERLRPGDHFVGINKTIPNQIRPDAETAAQQLECAVCKFNFNGGWICEHPGCRHCSGTQRRGGGLRFVIRLVGFHCPLAR